MLVHNRCGYKPLRQNDYKAVINPGETEAPHAHIFKKASNIGGCFATALLIKSCGKQRSNDVSEKESGINNGDDRCFLWKKMKTDFKISR